MKSRAVLKAAVASLESAASASAMTSFFGQVLPRPGACQQLLLGGKAFSSVVPRVTPIVATWGRFRPQSGVTTARRLFASQAAEDTRRSVATGAAAVSQF
jgi:hypothetical protein